MSSFLLFNRRMATLFGNFGKTSVFNVCQRSLSRRTKPGGKCSASRPTSSLVHVHGALRLAGGAAGEVQERHVFRLRRYDLERLRGLRERRGEIDGFRRRIGRAIDQKNVLVPLMKRLDSWVLNFFATSRASLIATLGGTPVPHRSSKMPWRRMLRSTTAMRSSSPRRWRPPGRTTARLRDAPCIRRLRNQ